MLSVPQNIIMDLNNVMVGIGLWVCVYKTNMMPASMHPMLIRMQV